MTAPRLVCVLCPGATLAKGIKQDVHKLLWYHKDLCLNAVADEKEKSESSVGLIARTRYPPKARKM